MMNRRRIPSIRRMIRQTRCTTSTTGTSSHLRQRNCCMPLLFVLLVLATMLLLGKVEAVLQHYAMDVVATTTTTTTVPQQQQDSSSSEAATTTTTSTTTKTYQISNMLLSHAYFGATLPMKNNALKTSEELQPFTLSYPPDETNALLCDNNNTSIYSAIDMPKTNQKFVMLVPRGECTFETKAYHAQLLGASAVIIYGTLASRYTYNATTTSS